MKLIFIDESKKQENSKNKFFLIQLGLVIDKDNLQKVEKEIEGLKQKWRIENLKKIREPPYTKETKLKFTRELSNILESNNVKVISSVLGDIALRNIRKIENSYFEAIKFVLERFFINLNKEGKSGIIIHDEVDKETENELKEKVYNLISKEEFKCRIVSKPYIDRIYPALMFSNDKHSNILQTSDLIALSLHNAIWKNWNNIKKPFFDSNKLPENNEFLKLYWNLFMKDPNGSVDGWGIKFWR